MRFSPEPSIDIEKYRPRHFRFAVADRVAEIMLDRPERKNPLTFESYGELRIFFDLLSTRAMSSGL